MLDLSTLDQLRGLKNQLESEKDRAEAVLRGTPSRYGFARVDDGREVFVPPDEMLKGFPGDRVRVVIRPGKDKRPVAEIEALISTPISEFTGRCVTKGKAMFVQPDIPEVSRWLFLPPQERGAAQEGDYVRCALLKHPIRDGKPQAKVLERIGSEQDPGIENRYTMAKYGLSSNWLDADAQAVTASLQADPLSDERREDFSDLAFVSIDAARTQDIDDALYAEVTADGWLLYVAIADPTAFIDRSSPLRDVVAARATSVYFHGAVVPMLPEAMAQQRCALVENELRPALVCRIAVTEDGRVGEYRFCEAKIRSRAKLSYFAVDRYLSGQDESLICHATPLEALYQVSRALRSRREAHELVMEDRQEYRWILDNRGHIDNVEPCEKLQSQRLVEECMVATNRCAASFLAEARATGPFVVHDGFRRDRHKDREKFLQQYVEDPSDIDPDSLEGYRDLLRRLVATEHDLPLRSMVNRLLTRARLSKNPGAHMGMSLPLYTNCTSPLRRYLDFLVHLQIKAVLRDEPAEICQQPELDALSQRLQKLRKISGEAERWLVLEYLQRLAVSTPGPWPGRVVYTSNNGFNVRLDASGLEGFVSLKKGKERFNFDKLTGTLKSKKRQFRVDMPVLVSLDGSEDEPAHMPSFRVESGGDQATVKDTAPETQPPEKSD